MIQQLEIYKQKSVGDKNLNTNRQNKIKITIAYKLYIWRIQCVKFQ